MGRRGRVRKFGTDNGFEEHGGYMAAKKAKLEEQFEKEAKILIRLHKGFNIVVPYPWFFPCFFRQTL